MAKRKNGEGNWGTRTINGVQYKYYRKYYDWKDDYHTFYGKTEKEINQKREQFELANKDKHKFDAKNVKQETFYHYCKHWIEDIKPNDGSDTKQVTIDSYADMLDNRIKDTFLGNTQIASLSEDIFQDYIDDYCVKQKEYSRGTIKRTQSLLNQICEYMYETDKYAPCNYMEDIIIPSEKNVKTKRRKVPFLEESDMLKLYDEFQKMHSTGKSKYGLNAHMVIFIMYTGLRISEALALKWKDVNLDLNIITITHVIAKIRNPKGDKPKHIYVDTDGTKTYSSERSIPLSDIALLILQGLWKNQDPNYYVFTEDGVTISNHSNVTRTLNLMQKNANCKIKKSGLHSLRHTFGSYLILKGVDIKTVSELLGHSSIEITLNIYVHIINAQKASAIKLFNNVQKQVNTTPVGVVESLSKVGISLIEIEEGMLGYIENGKLVKLPINKTLAINDIIINNIDIYNEYYKSEE